MVSVNVAILLFIGSLAVLLKASDVFTSATARVGLSIGISLFIIGATVVALGTSLPELVSSMLAVVRGAPNIVMGNVVGSNIANILIVLGLAAMVGGRIRVERELMRVDLPILVASAVFLLVAVWDSAFQWYEGVLAIIALVAYVHSTLTKPARLDDTVEELVEEHFSGELEGIGPADAELDVLATETPIGVTTYLSLFVSLVLLIVSADLLVRSILDLAIAFEVGPAIVALTAVGIGTSVPEIAVSVAAVRGGNPEIAVGNVLGSNVFNSLAVIGIPSLFVPLTMPSDMRTYALPVMVIATVLYYFVTQDREITQCEGGMLLILYVVFLLNLF